MIVIILLALMITSLAIKWITTLSIGDRHAKLNAANEDYWRGKNKHKALVGEISMADHEISRLERKIRAAEHRMAKMTKQQGTLQQDASSRVYIEQEKIRLAEEVRKSREGGS